METTSDTLRALIARIGISQRHAARLIGISERQMRSYLADPETASTAIEAPAYVALSLEGILARVETVRDAVTPDMLADYLTAEYGDWIDVYRDGRWQVREGSTVVDDDDIIASVRCPGIGNIDSSRILDGWASMDDDTGQYVVSGRYHDDRGRVIGDLDDAICECCRDGDMSGYLEDLERELIEKVLSA